MIRKDRLATLIACVALAIAAPTQAAEIEKFTVIDNDRWQSYPQISGGLVVYNNTYGGSVYASDRHVDGYNILTDHHFNVDGDTYYDSSAPSVSGRYVAWVKKVGVDSHIYVRNVVSGTPFAICTEAGWRGVPQISGGTIVWYDSRGGKKAIYGYNLASPGEFVIVADKAGSQLSLDGDILVYLDQTVPSRTDIRGYNLSTKADFLVSDGVNVAREPDVSGNIAVYRSNHPTGGVNPGSNIYAFNIATSTEFAISTTTTTSNMPRIDGNVVVWSDYRDGNPNIYGKNIATGYEFRITDSAVMERWSDISGDIVVWQDEAVLYRSDIFGARLNIPNMFVQGTFDGGAMGPWTASGAGTAGPVEDPHDPSNYCLELLTGSPVTVTHSVSTPDRIFDILFDYEFTTTSGTLTIELDGQLLDTIDAPPALVGAFESYRLRVADPTLQSLNNVLLAFTLDETGGMPSGVMLDEIDFHSIPEPATLGILALGTLAIFRRRRR